MTAAFFIGDWFGLVTLALICYVGIILNAAGASIRGLERPAPATLPLELLVSVMFLGLLPLPSATVGVWVVQFALVVFTLALMGPFQLRFALMRYREVRAYQAGITAAPLGWGFTALLFAPPLLLAVVIVGVSISGGVPWSATGIDQKVLDNVSVGMWHISPMVLLFGMYLAASWVLDRTWLRVVGSIRLLSADARFVWLNALLALASVGATAVIVGYGIGSRAARYSLLVILALAVLPSINGLFWIYDAVFRRVVMFHLLVAVGAVVIFGTRWLLESAGLSGVPVWVPTLTILAAVALILPERVGRLLERWVFPRAAEMRARLLHIATDPLAAPTRSEAGRELLRRVVEVLDSEGGFILIEPSVSEPVTLHTIGRVDPTPLGATPAEIADSVRELGLGNVALPLENFPLAIQLRLLHCGIVFVCPLVARQSQAMLLLGYRRGWLYDTSTIGALRVFASQAALTLENVALANARTHAEKLAALGEAAARIAHEIRNPLTAARSLVQQTAAADGVADLAEPALGELDRIGQLVSDLLAFARRDDAVKRESVDLYAVCSQAHAQIAPLAAEAGVEVVTELDCVLVAGDRNRLVQVVANLCRNAIEALDGQPPPRRLHIRCVTNHRLGTIEVRDNGPGVAAAELPRLFEPFATTKQAGTGLGLPIAKRIVEGHGGHLVVESAPGAETVFRVELPLADELQRADVS